MHNWKVINLIMTTLCNVFNEGAKDVAATHFFGPNPDKHTIMKKI